MTGAPGAWRYALASVAGTSHARQGTPCQDAAACELLATGDGSPLLVAVVADGAGSAARSDEGAQLACGLFVERIRALLADGGGPRDLTREFVATWLARFQGEIATRAEAADAAPRDYACTLLAAVVGDDSAAYCQIGDGAIVVAAPDDPEDYGWVFWPQQGEYENTTHFATDPAATNLIAVEQADLPVDEVALFSDGLQRLALHYEGRTAHAPFFRPMFAPVRAADPGRADALSAQLATFLASPPVNARTDDDKTLILATRRSTAPVETPPAPGE
ncbi:MAG: PP2C family serine/threonine-protein phosphatase [Thermomicrobiales bacterium]